MKKNKPMPLSELIDLILSYEVPDEQLPLGTAWYGDYAYTSIGFCLIRTQQSDIDEDAISLHWSLKKMKTVASMFENAVYNIEQKGVDSPDDLTRESGYTYDKELLKALTDRPMRWALNENAGYIVAMDDSCVVLLMNIAKDDDDEDEEAKRRIRMN